MANLDISFLPWQSEVHSSGKRFRVVAAGRRSGKTYWSCNELILAALDESPGGVMYIAPTQGQARDIMWKLLMERTQGILEKYHINNLEMTLINGQTIALKGADRPDTMRGVANKLIVLDEYADMKTTVWEEILRPTLTDYKGRAIFIGTPKGRNHFYNLFNDAELGRLGDNWGAWHFTSYDNPKLSSVEIDDAKSTLSGFAFKQEYMASFEASASDIFKPEWFKIEEKEPEEGEWVISVDLAGFEQVEEQNKAKRKHLDESVIVTAKVHPTGWWIKDIAHGRWDTRETATRILKAARDVNTKHIGIEKGSLKNAIGPYLREQMGRLGYFCRIEELTHGNRKKSERIVWSLQGRMEHGRIGFNRGDWNRVLLDQLMQFPDSKTHDDLVDALSYIEQIATISFSRQEQEEFVPYDEDVGY